MPLNIPALPPPGQGLAQAVAHVRIGHPAVQDVDAQLLRLVHHRPALLGAVALHPLRAESNLADHQAGFSKSAVIHRVPPISHMMKYILPALRDKCNVPRRVDAAKRGLFNNPRLLSNEKKTAPFHLLVQFVQRKPLQAAHIRHGNPPRPKILYGGSIFNDAPAPLTLFSDELSPAANRTPG